MKAISYEKFGGVELLQLGNVTDAKAGDKDLLIKVSHAGVNPVDWKIREGYLAQMLPHSFPIIPGWDVSGTVLAKGKDVTDWAIGNRVFAYARKEVVSHGTYAELVAVPAVMVAATPFNISDAEAAGVPLAALTAWQGLHRHIKIKPKQRVLIHAGAGGVGNFAIQFAKLAQATVITTATKSKHDYLKTLGADIVIDYSEVDFVQRVKELYPDGIDAVFDGVGAETLERSFSLVKRGGMVLSIVETPSQTLGESLGLSSGFMFVEPNGQELQQISNLIAEEKVKVPSIEVMPLHMAKEAMTKSQTRRTLGKMVLDIKG